METTSRKKQIVLLSMLFISFPVFIHFYIQFLEKNIETISRFMLYPGNDVLALSLGVPVAYKYGIKSNQFNQYLTLATVAIVWLVYGYNWVR